MSIESLLILLTSGIGQGPANTPTADEVLEHALKQRRAITRAAVTLRCFEERPGGQPREQEILAKIWLDGDRLRADYFYSKAPGHPVTRDVMCRNCEEDRHYVMYLEGRASYATLGKIGDPQQNNLTIVDPRVLGVVPTTFGTMFHYRIDSILGQADRSPPTLNRAKWKDHDCLVVRYTQLTDAKLKVGIWVIPSMDYSVARIEMENESNGAKEILESDLKRYGKADIWYPKSCMYESYDKGQLYRRDTIEVSAVTLNEAIAPATFKMLGMDIPPGTRVSGLGLPDRGGYFWDGLRIVKEKAGRPQQSTLGEPRQNNGIWLIVVGAGLALTAGLAVWFFFRKTKVAARPASQ